MKELHLGPSAFIVLGLLSKYGSATSYDLKRWADDSVGHFWNFPQSQLYSEPQRLAQHGLINESQEEWGRRKRILKITIAGQNALENWLRSPAGRPELRDPGLLKLYFIELTDVGVLKQLSREQLELHQKQLLDYQTQTQDLKDQGADTMSILTLRMGVLYEEACVNFWKEVGEVAEGKIAQFAVPEIT